MPPRKHDALDATHPHPPRRTTQVDETEADEILNQNILLLAELHRHASSDVVAAKVVEAVKSLLDELIKDQRPSSRSEEISLSLDEGSPPPTPDPPSRKRRRQDIPSNDRSRREQMATTNLPEAAQTTPATAVKASVKTKRSRRTARSVTQPASKPAPVLAISRNCGPTELSAIRTKFKSALLRLEPSSRRNETNKSQEFTPDEVTDLTAFFFDEVMGPVSLQRLIGLVKSYTPSADAEADDNGDNDTVDGGAIFRFQKIARDVQAPMVIRRFFGSFQNHQRLHNTNVIVTHLQQIIESRQLLHNFERVRAHVENADPAILAYLKERGMTVGVGRGWTTVAIDFLANHAQIKRSTLINMCERAKGINTLVNHFGEGILPLLPPGSMHRLRKYGSKRMEYAYDLLSKHVQSFQPICDLTKDYVYTPFLNGDPSLRLDVFHLTAPKSQNFIDILTDAASPIPVPNPGSAAQEVEGHDSD